MEKEKVFELLSEGGGVTIWRVTVDGNIHYLYDHLENDFSDSGLEFEETKKYQTFRRAFKKIHKEHDWHFTTLTFVHEDYREYVIKKLIEKLNEKKQRSFELHSFKRLELALKGYLLEEFDKGTDKINWRLFI